MKSKQEYFSITEAAEILGVHPNTIRKRIKDGSMPASQRPYKWYISADAIKQFVTPTNAQPAR